MLRQTLANVLGWRLLALDSTDVSDWVSLQSIINEMKRIGRPITMHFTKFPSEEDIQDQNQEILGKAHTLHHNA